MFLLSQEIGVLAIRSFHYLFSRLPPTKSDVKLVIHDLLNVFLLIKKPHLFMLPYWPGTLQLFRLRQEIFSCGLTGKILSVCWPYTHICGFGFNRTKGEGPYWDSFVARSQAMFPAVAILCRNTPRAGSPNNISIQAVVMVFVKSQL